MSLFGSEAPPKQHFGGPLKILQLKQGSSEVEILVDNLQKISRSLHESGAALVSIVSVMGTYRTGKSFLLDLLMRYLKTRAADATKLAAAREAEAEAHTEAFVVVEPPPPSDGPRSTWRLAEEDRSKTLKPPAWVLEGNALRLAEGSKTDDNQEGFAWRPGKDKCTQGIWLWSTPFIFPDKDGRKIAVLLMDTQGAWDDTMTKAQSATIFGLTALLSSKLIYNIQNRVEEDKLENMDYITTFAQTVCADLPGKDAPFGHLELLVRDWANYEDGFSTEQCEAQMAEHLDDHLNPEKVPVDAVPRVERLRSTFKSIGSFGLPHPGLKVTKPAYCGEIDSIDPDFLFLLDEWTRNFFGKEFPQPSAPLGCEITVSTFLQIVMNFAEAFRENAGDMAIGLREAFVKVEMMTCRDDLLKRFREQLNRVAPDSSVLDPSILTRDLEKLKVSFREEFQTKLRPWRMKDSEEHAAVSEFAQVINEAVNVRTFQNDQQVEGATMKLVAAPVVGTGAYFLLVHHWVLYIVAGTGAYFHMKKWAVKGEVEMYDPSVVQGVVDDAKKFCLQRYKDVQAMQVALQRCNPNDAMETLMKASRQAGMLAASAAATASSSAATTTPRGAHQVNGK